MSWRRSVRGMGSADVAKSGAKTMTVSEGGEEGGKDGDKWGDTKILKSLLVFREGRKPA